MHAGEACRLDHLLRIAFAHAGDVLAHGAVEQFYILRQVTDVTAEVLGMPLGNIDAVKPGIARSRLQITHQDAGQGRLAGRGRPYDPQGLARLEAEGDAAQRRLGRTGVNVCQP